MYGGVREGSSVWWGEGELLCIVWGGGGQCMVCGGGLHN